MSDMFENLKYLILGGFALVLIYFVIDNLITKQFLKDLELFINIEFIRFKNKNKKNGKK